MLSGVTTYRTFKSTITELGTLTDDGRMLAADMVLTFRTFPLALGWQEKDVMGHEEAWTVGVIEQATLEGSKVVATGYLLNTAQADQAAEMIEHKVTRPSVDLGAATSIYTDEDGNPVDLDAWFESEQDTPLIETVTEGKVLGATLVRIAAFDRPTDIELTGTVELGDPAVEAVVASLTPITAAGERTFADDFRPRRELFDDPELTGFTHPTYDEATGRVFGHVAPFGKTHIGFAGKRNAPTAPRSASGYAYFHTARLTAADSEPLMVGKMTVATGHAGLRLAGEPAAAHYDDTGSCWAYVRCGEDEHGIWFSGVLHPSATDAQVRDGLASPLSGDWRPINPPGLELVAALSVNTPGFPLVASATDDDGQILALVAALAPRRHTFAEGDDMPTAEDNTDTTDESAVKFPVGSKVTVKDGDDTEAEVTEALTEQTVYRVGDAWYLENELEPVEDTPPPAAEPVSAAAIARELHAMNRRERDASSVVDRVLGQRRAREARSVIATMKAGK